MTILFAATLPPGSSTLIGRTLPLARAAQKHGHTVHVVTLGDTERAETPMNVPVTVVGPALRGPTAERHPLWELSRRLRFGSRAIAGALSKQRPDVLVLVKPHPQNVSAARTVSCPIVLDADDDERWASRLSPLERAVMGYLEWRAARRAALVTVCSPALGQRYSLQLRAPRIALIPTGIAPSATPARNLREALRLPPATPLLLYLGSIALSSGHRVDHLVDVWDTLAEKMPTLHLVIAGDGIDHALIRERASRARHGRRIYFTGRFAPEEAESLARQATLLVDPVDRSPASQAKSSSRTLLALLTGVPIVAGDVGIRKLFLPPAVQSWALYPPEHPEQFLQALLYGLTPEARHHFQKETAGLWKQWSWERLGHQFLSAVEEVIP
jgi:glycosyltransferase involved in cell wall biosynthesis